MSETSAPIVVTVHDKISPSINKKLSEMATKADAADMAIRRLNTTMATTRGLDPFRHLSKTAGELEARMNKLIGTSNQASQAAQKYAAAQDKAARSSGGLWQKLTSLKTIVTGLAVAMATNSIVGGMDAFQNLQNRLANLSSSAEGVEALTDAMFELANKTRSPIQTTTSAFQRFDNTLKEMGGGQAETLRLVETLNKAASVSGATAAEASSATLQLSQAFASGRLNGEEYRAVMENMPIVADMIAKSMGVTRSELKKLSTAGLITADVMRNALAGGAAEVDAKFAKMKLTIGQSLVILDNKWQEFIGRFGKGSGIADGITKSISFVGDHLNEIIGLAFSVGAAMLVAFGPQIIASITQTGGAIAKLGTALAANPMFGLAIVLTGIVAALVYFRDEIFVCGDGMTTLGDVFRATGDIIMGVIDAITGAFSDGTEANISSWEKFKIACLTVLEVIWDVIRWTVNGITGLMVGTVMSIGKVWDKLPEVFRMVWDGVKRVTGEYLNAILKMYVFAFEKAGGLIGSFAPETAEAIKTGLKGAQEFLDKNLLSAQLDLDPLKDIGRAVADEMSSAMSYNFVGVAVNDLFAAARKEAEKRKTAEAELRKAGEKRPGAPGKGKGETGAELWAKINRELDFATANLYRLAGAREDDAKVMEYANSLAEKGFRINAEQAQMLRDKVTGLREGAAVQAEMDRLIEEAIGPAQAYNATILGAAKALEKGYIEQDRYNAAVAAAEDSYQKATNPLYEMQLTLAANNQLLKARVGSLESERKIQEALTKAQKLGLSVNEAQVRGMQAKIDATDRLIRIQQHQEDFDKAARDRRGESLAEQIEAAKRQMASDPTYTQQEALIDLEGQYESTYANIDLMRRENMLKERDASNLKRELWRKQNAEQIRATSQFFDDLSTLQESNNKSMAKVGKAAAIAQATINTYQAATGAYAAMASIPYVGPILGAAAAGAAIIAGMANIAKIRGTGFESGGYTGNGGRSEVAGVVHGREFVMNSAATSRLGRDDLAALQAGRASIVANSRAANDSGAESVGTKRKRRVTDEGGDAPNVDIMNVTVLDPAVLDQMVASNRGQRTMMNFIHQNRSSIKKTVNS